MICKDIKKGFDYEASYDGKIFLKDCNRPCKSGTRFLKRREIKPYPHGNYLAVRINLTGKLKHHNVHRLVADAWIPNPNPKKFDQVNHKNGNKHDNSVPNLERSNASHNMLHAYKTGLMVAPGNRKGMNGDLNGTNKHVLRLNLKGIVMKEYESISLTRKDGFIPSCVSRCAKGQLSQHGGFKWEFVKS